MIIESSDLYMSTIKRQHIYVLVVFFTIALCITKQHIEQESLSKHPNMDAQNNINEEYEDYYELDILYPLEIRNYQNDNIKLEYIYKLKIDGISGTYKYKYKDKENYMVFTANGEAQIVLESNESITIYDVPDNSTYEIEQLTDVSDKYTTKIDNKENNKTTGTITSTSLVEFDNETIKEIVEPDHQEENPYTKDKHYLILLMSTVALVLILCARNLKVKRFG